MGDHFDFDYLRYWLVSIFSMIITLVIFLMNYIFIKEEINYVFLCLLFHILLSYWTGKGGMNNG